MTTYNGYTKDLSPEEKRKNEIESIKSILKDDPKNEYLQNRLAELTCSCFLYMGDNVDCPVHGGTVKSFEQLAADYYSDYGTDYQERNDLCMMAIGA